jgi:dipeptidyl-peptidase-4
MGSDLAIGFFDGSPGAKLTTGAKPGKEFTTLSPDGTRVAYVRDGNLFAASADDPGEKQLTTDGGKNDILNARGDWVYEEEIFNRNGRAFWWSPDGKHLAFLRFDDTPVKRFHLTDNRETAGKLEAYPYPKVGDPNPTVTIGVTTASGKPKFLDMTGYPAADTLISRVGWLPSGKVFAYVQNRTQTWLDFVVWDTVDSKPKKLFRETTGAWVDDIGEPHFLSDGSMLIASERTGFKHAYHYKADGTLVRQVTKGDWEIKDLVRIDEKAGSVYFTGTKDGHTRSHLYRCKLDGGDVERLTPAAGTHTTTIAPAGLLFVDRYSDSTTPPQVALREIGVKEPVRMLDNNPARDKDNFKFGKVERVTVPMKDGFDLEGTVTYPPDFDATKKYPIWLMTYAGPNAPTVRDGFGIRGGMEQTLATSGIVVFRIDPRSASGKCAAATWTCYKQLGVQELKDLEEAVAWLCKNPWADSTRVGISGHSYGGFMAAYALTHSKTFSAGIASSGVHDWRLYDSIYTERYMLTPKENPEGYDKTSCIKAASKLNGKLLIIHGMMDDNVHLQNSTQFITALQAANKDFEMMFYPQSRHGIGSPHYLKTELEFIRRTMGVKK